MGLLLLFQTLLFGPRGLHAQWLPWSAIFDLPACGPLALPGALVGSPTEVGVGARGLEPLSGDPRAAAHICLVFYSPPFTSFPTCSPPFTSLNPIWLSSFFT